jgi:RNA polymerase sigma-70 factor (ECF subfamily)
VTTTSTVSNPYLKDPDAQLMLRVRDGDEAAFAQLVASYQDRLIGVLTNLTGDRTTAEDVAQEVFLRVYRARQGYEVNAKFSTWIFSIAHNLASNTRRSKGRRKETQLADPENSGPQAAPQAQMVPEKSALMPSRLMARAELMGKVQAAMDTLNDRQRMALLLHKFEGMNYIDIGAAMEMTPQAVKSLLSRARDQLRIALEEYAK